MAQFLAEALLTMETEIYSIEFDGHAGFQVWVERSKGESGHVAITFPTYEQAREWIKERMKVGNRPTSGERPPDYPGKYRA
jgi:hypothetical protein